MFAVLFVVVPVLRFRGLEKTDDSEIRKQKNIEVFRQRLKELEQDLADELIANEQFENLKTELQRGFMSDMDDAEPGEPQQKKSTVELNRKINKLVPLAWALFIPIASFFLYENIGSARDLVLPELLDQIGNAGTQELQEQALDDLAIALQKRFKRRSDDIQNGYMLGTLYLELEQYDDAVGTFTLLADMMEDSPERATVLGQLAQSQYMSADSLMTSAVQATIDEALNLNPNEYAVMSLLAIEAFMNENFGEALNYWRRQLLQATPGSSQAAVLIERIATVESLIPAGEQGISQGQAAEASVTITVELDESILDQLEEGMRLFVYARSPAMPAPLAALNLSAAGFPLTITLDDSMFMIPGRTLSTSETLLVGARISKSGQAIAQAGDFQAISEPFVLTEQIDTITLTIKDIVP